LLAWAKSVQWVLKEGLLHTVAVRLMALIVVSVSFSKKEGSCLLVALLVSYVQYLSAHAGSSCGPYWGFGSK
jgi:hypothetical protein